MSVKIGKTGGRIKSNAIGERKIHCRENVALKSFEQQIISQSSPQLTDESEFPSLNELSNKVCASPQSSRGIFKYSDKLKLHSNQNTAPNYFCFQQEPIKKDLNDKSNQTLSSPQLKNKWFQDTNRNKVSDKSVTQTNKQNEPDKPDFVNRRILNTSLIDHRSQSNASFRESPSTKNEFKNQSQKQKHVVNKSDSKLHSSVKLATTNSHVTNQPAKSCHQVQSKNEIKLILGKNSIKEASNDSSEASKKKKKRKSKVKRQIALQTGKITVLTPEVHSKILNQTSVLATQNFKTVLTDINDENEYPELGKSTMPTSQKENYPKKEVNSSEPVSEDCKKNGINERKVEVSVEEHHLVTKDVTKEFGHLPASDDKSVTEKKGKDSKPVHPNDPITVSFFDILVNKNCKTKVKDLKTEVDLPLSTGLIKAKAKKNSIHPHNLLDSSSPAVKRGKEREKPKPKKPSQLKKIILMDRKARREQLLQLKSNNVQHENSALWNESELVANESKNNEIYCEDILALIEDQSEHGSQDLHEDQYESLEENSNLVLCDDGSVVLHDDFDHLKVINLLPTNETDYNVSNILSLNENCVSEDASMTLNPNADVIKCTEGDNLSMKIFDSSSDVESVNNNNSESADCAIVTDSTVSSEKQLDFQLSPDLLENCETNVEQVDLVDKEKAVKILLHTRNFREYCNHLISKDIDDVVYALLDDLARFQDRMHQKDPIKARMKRRMIYGVKEVKKHVKLKKLKCIIVAADIENIETHGGLNDLLNDIKSSAADHHIPCIFALSRKALGKVCRKPVPVSCVGVFNYEGSEVNFKKMIELQAQSKIDYAEISTKLSDTIIDEQILSLLKAKREAPETLRAIRATILGDFFLENKTKIVEPKKISVTNEK